MTDTHRDDEADASDPRSVPPSVAESTPGTAGAGGGQPGAGGGHAPDYETGGIRLALLALGVTALGLLAGWSILLVVLGVLVMVLLHELGHFATAKWSGMKVTEFFVGIGPRIWSIRRGETEYGIKLVPVLAYVRIVGMSNLEEVDPGDEPRTYRQQSFPKRLLVVSAGSIMHFAQAFVLLVLLLGVVGFRGGSIVDPPDEATAWEVSEVTDDSAADDAGLATGDRILAIDGRPARAFDDFGHAIGSYDVGDEIDVTLERDGERRSLPVELGARPARVAGGEPGGPFLGVGTFPEYPDDPIGLGTALVRAPGEMVRFTGESVGALVGFFSPDGISDFADNVGRADDPAQSGSGGSGSVSSDDGSENRMLSIYGAVRMGAQLSEDGWAWLLVFFFQINIFIGIFNMVPLPPLDGGHAAVAVYERIRSRAGRRYHADMAKLLPLTWAVVMGLVVLGVASLYLDIVNPVDL